MEHCRCVARRPSTVSQGAEGHTSGHKPRTSAHTASLFTVNGQDPSRGHHGPPAATVALTASLWKASLARALHTAGPEREPEAGGVLVVGAPLPD